MAKSKKKGAKSTARSKKKSAKPAPKRAAKRAAPIALSAEQRRTMVKPPPGYPALVRDTIEAWSDHKSVVRLAHRTPAQLASQLLKAERAAEKERAFNEKIADTQRELRDARMQAEHDVWTTTLAVYRVARAQMPTAPAVAAAFEHLSDAFSRSPKRKPEEPAPTDETEDVEEPDVN